MILKKMATILKSPFLIGIPLRILLTFFENIVPYHFRAIQLTFFVEYIVKVETH